jgi:tripartite-type tricarboxylate transporter receptor subunit TctC
MDGVADMPLILLAPTVLKKLPLLRLGARFKRFSAAVLRTSAWLLASLLAGQATVSAQEVFPSRALKVIVPQPPGGGFDFVGRTLADKLATQLKQPVVVENRPGSGTLVGTDAAAKAAPDGYTLLVGSVSNLALNPGLYPTLPYDPIKDFEPLGLAVSYSYTLIARRDLPLSSLAEVIAFARSNPGKLTYASGGNGSGQHVLAAALWHLAGVKLTHVPYRGAQAAYTDLLGGRVDLFFDLSPTARPQVDAGTVRALAVSGAARSPLHPGVPTVKETGVAPLELESWFGLFVPARTPTAEAAVLQRELMVAMSARDVMERFERAGGRPLALGAAESRQMVARDVERWTKLVRELGLKAD